MFSKFLYSDYLVQISISFGCYLETVLIRKNWGWDKETTKRAQVLTSDHNGMPR